VTARSTISFTLAHNYENHWQVSEISFGEDPIPMLVNFFGPEPVDREIE